MENDPLNAYIEFQDVFLDVGRELGNADRFKHAFLVEQAVLNLDDPFAGRLDRLNELLDQVQAEKGQAWSITIHAIAL